MAKKPPTKTKKENAAPVEDAVVVDEPVSSNEAHGEEENNPEVLSQDETTEDVFEEVNESEPDLPTEPKGGSGRYLTAALGGLVAVGIGYAVGFYQFSQVETQVEANANAVAALRSEIENLPLPTDTSSFEAEFATIAETLEGLEARYDQVIGSIDERLASVERQPTSDGTLQDVAITAFQSDLEALRGQISTQQEELQAMMNSTTAQLQATRDEAKSLEERSIETAKFAQVRSAISRIQTALETGAPIGGSLDEFEAISGEEAPEALRNVADGTPTLASLNIEFPEAARAALNVARSEGQSGEASGGFTAFLRDQLSVRSTSPQEGDDVDAVLSRAEAALTSGRLNEALSELNALPEVSRAALAHWISDAELRSHAMDEAASLFARFNAN